MNWRLAMVYDYKDRPEDEQRLVSQYIDPLPIMQSILAVAECRN